MALPLEQRDPYADKFARWLYLDDLRRKLLAAKFDKLGLKNLQPLRDEVEAELKVWRAP